METNNKPQNNMSNFCETLMRTTEAIGFLKEGSDTAIVLCSDGNTVASRQCGFYPSALNMVVVKMLKDVKFAELIVEAGMIYSQRMVTSTNAQGRNNALSFDIIQGIQQTEEE